MKITLIRIANRPTYCIGKLYIDGIYECDTIEDTDRGLDDSMSVKEVLNKKIKGQTAIPCGTYPIEITYSPKYKRLMPLILNVKGYSGIRIHSGNTSKDTEGCLLVGKNTVVGMVTDSRNTYQKLYAKLYNQKDIEIEIKRKYNVSK